MKPALVALIAALATLSFASAPSLASQAEGGPESFRFSPRTYEIVARQSAGHPNERSRWNGLWSYSSQRYEQAREHFQRAARHGDKPSQLVLSMMHWHGEGGPRDPAVAYIWADLAAERGTVPEMLAFREMLWAELGETDRARVVQDGPSMYREFGDATARVRTDNEVRRFSRNRTGSRTGSSAGSLSANLVGAPLIGTMREYDAPGLTCQGDDAPPLSGPNGTDLYADCRVDRDRYWREQDLVLKEMLSGRALGRGASR